MNLRRDHYSKYDGLDPSLNLNPRASGCQSGIGNHYNRHCAMDTLALISMKNVVKCDN